MTGEGFRLRASILGDILAGAKDVSWRALSSSNTWLVNVTVRKSPFGRAIRNSVEHPLFSAIPRWISLATRVLSPGVMIWRSPSKLGA
jgi:hypothetical protein